MARRRVFLKELGALLTGLAAPSLAGAPAHASGASGAPLTLFLAGDVMTGRGLDQALPHPVDPQLYEAYVRSARDYVTLAAKASGALSLPLDFAYPWGDALAEFARVKPALRLVNLETAVTDRGEPWPDKGIHYRMHPGNLPCIEAAGIDGVSLANNHVLDWGQVGLDDTIRHLGKAGIACAGAGPDLAAASAPCVFATGAGRVLFFGACTSYSGVPKAWAAEPRKPGVNFTARLGDRSVQEIATAVARVRQPGDLVILSLHWGGNWGYRIDPDERSFAHRLIDEAGVDLLHGHSSHHPKGIELYRGKAILYGCGDFLNDYEGIRGEHGEYRGELTLMYFPALDPATGTVVSFEAVPLRIRRFRLQHASDEEASWLAGMLDRESRPLGVRAVLGAHNRIALGPA